MEHKEHQEEDVPVAFEKESTEEELGGATRQETGIRFKKYSSFEGPTDRAIAEAQEHGSPDDQWVVLEKVHGSNMSLITDGEKVAVAKRTAMLCPGAKFFKYENVVEQYRQSALKAFEIVRALIPETRVLFIYGELFGGGYPHPDVQREEGQILVQREVFYAPWTGFYAFDLSTGTGYLDYDLATQVFDEAGFLFAQPLFKGNLQQALRYPLEFRTTLPSKLGLPPIDGNIAEGIVVKRVRRSRPIFKLKSQKFLEVFPGARPGTVGAKNRKEKQAQDAPQPIPEVIEEARRYINPNRMASVVSKEGEVHLADASRLIGLLAKDALKDFMKDHGGEEAWKRGQPKEVQGLLGKVICQDSRKVVFDWFTNK